MGDWPRHETDAKNNMPHVLSSEPKLKAIQILDPFYFLFYIRQDIEVAENLYEGFGVPSAL